MSEDLTDAPEPAGGGDYGAESIRVLKGLDAVRKRPGMYIGDTDDGSGLHHMVYEVVDNAIDEALAGYASHVQVTLNPDGSCTVIDDGRGIPVDIHSGEGVSAAEVIMTQLHAGGKFDQNSYKVSGGLHGVGVSVVNALSDFLQLKIWRNGKEYEMRFERGDAVGPLLVTGDAPVRTAPDKKAGEHLTGTSVTFMPSVKTGPAEGEGTFTAIEFDRKTLEHRLRELAFLNSGVVINFKDLREDRAVRGGDVHYDGGVEAFVRHLDKSKTSDPEGADNRPVDSKEQVEIDLSLWWNDGYHETDAVLHQQHSAEATAAPTLAAFRAALTRVISSYVETSGAGKREKVSDLGRGCARGADLRAVGEAARSEVQLTDERQAGLLRGAPGCGGAGQRGASRQWFEEHPIEAKLIVRQDRRSRRGPRSRQARRAN